MNLKSIYKSPVVVEFDKENATLRDLISKLLVRFSSFILTRDGRVVFDTEDFNSLQALEGLEGSRGLDKIEKCPFSIFY